MRYERFVRLRRAGWEELESRLEKARRREPMSYADLEHLAFLYRQAALDHAWARTHYPGTATARWLADLTVRGSHWLRGREGRRGNNLGRFLGVVFPRAARRHLRSSGICLGLFVVAGLFGLAAAILDPTVVAALLPPDALEGLAEGRLWTESLTTTVPPSVSSSAIATNNMSVALTAFSLGALFGLGALWVVLLNGYLLGGVIGGTLRFSMAGELLEFVAAHGPLEITLILVASGVGLRVGSSWFVAEDRPRSVVMGEAGREGLIVILGCLPWFLLLGLVEAVISPHPGLPVSFKILVGLALLALFLAWVFYRPGGPLEARPQRTGGVDE